MSIDKVKEFSGGVLGEQAKAINALIQAFKDIKAGHSIKLTKNGENGFTIAYGGPVTGELPAPTRENYILTVEAQSGGFVWVEGTLKAIADEA